MSIAQKRARILETRYDIEIVSPDDPSPVSANIRYYQDHPEKYSPKKIQKETWLSQEIRNDIKDRLNDFMIYNFGSVSKRVNIRHHYYVQKRYARGRIAGRIYSQEKYRRSRVKA